MYSHAADEVKSLPIEATEVFAKIASQLFPLEGTTLENGAKHTKLSHISLSNMFWDTTQKKFELLIFFSRNF